MIFWLFVTIEPNYHSLDFQINKITEQNEPNAIGNTDVRINKSKHKHFMLIHCNNQIEMSNETHRKNSCHAFLAEIIDARVCISVLLILLYLVVSYLVCFSIFLHNNRNDTAH